MKLLFFLQPLHWYLNEHCSILNVAIHIWILLFWSDLSKDWGTRTLLKITRKYSPQQIRHSKGWGKRIVIQKLLANIAHSKGWGTRILPGVRISFCQFFGVKKQIIFKGNSFFIYSKYWPSASTHLAHLQGKLWIPCQKNFFFCGKSFVEPFSNFFEIA